MKQCALIKLSPPASSSSQNTLLMLVQTAFNTSTAHNKGVATVILYEDRLYYADTKGVAHPIETAITEEKSHSPQAYYDFLIDYDLLKNLITAEYRLANLDELKLANTILGITPKANEPALTNAVIGVQKQPRRHLPLPDDTINVIAEYLTPKEKLRLALSEVVYTPSRLFSNRQQTLINRLIEFTLQGNQIKVEQMLKRHPEYAVIKGTAPDYSGRLFHNVSAFECALWARDWYMYNMMLDCLPHNEHGEQTRLMLLEQYNTLKTDGLTYTLEGKTTSETHYNLQPLIDALKEYDDKFDSWNWEQCDAHWCKVVGLIQRYVPAIVAQHYCNPHVAFSPLPTFNEKALTRSLMIDNWITNKKHSWFLDSGISCRLGFDFGILRAAAWPPAGFAMAWPSCLDSAALTALCKVSEENHNQFKQTLEIPRQKPDDKPEPGCVIS